MSEVVEALMANVIDYAGLFPPAGLPMQEAVRNYGAYKRSEHAWMLGRFVVPMLRLQEFVRNFEQECCTEQEQPWLLSLLPSKDAEADVTAMERFSPGAAFLDSIEMGAGSAEEAQRLLALYPQELTRFVECAPEKLGDMLPVLKKHGARAKIRTGGVVPEAIPSVDAVADFILACAASGVAFKATAGLHHPVRAEHPLTYEQGSASATMHGFLNVFTASLLAHAGAARGQVIAALGETSTAAFHAGRKEFRWQEHRFSTEQVAEARKSFIISFGSCSFAEPLQALEEMQWL